MRYEVRWSNGYWKTFDTFFYRSIELHHTRAEAQANVDELNGVLVRRAA